MKGSYHQNIVLAELSPHVARPLPGLSVHGNHFDRWGRRLVAEDDIDQRVQGFMSSRMRANVQSHAVDHTRLIIGPEFLRLLFSTPPRRLHFLRCNFTTSIIQVITDGIGETAVQRGNGHRNWLIYGDPWKHQAGPVSTLRVSSVRRPSQGAFTFSWSTSRRRCVAP